MSTLRAFETAVRGRPFTEPAALLSHLEGPDRAAHVVAACRAVEAARHAWAPDQIEELRRLLCCASWIEGHATHLHRVQLPELLGHPDVAGFAAREPAAAARGLELHRAGLRLSVAVGEGVLRAGGPYQTPHRRSLTRLRPQLDDALAAAVETAHWVSGVAVPESVLDVPLLALDDPVTGPVGHGRARYPTDGGAGVLASTGLGFPLDEFESFVQRARSGPLSSGRATLRGAKASLTGPLARNALCGHLLGPVALGAARRAGLTAQERNPYRSALIRAVELVHALEEAAALVDGYEPPEPAPAPAGGSGRGLSAVEGPSGLVYQRYDVLADGVVGAVRLIGPDELNRSAIELDLRRTERSARRRDPEIDSSRLAELRAVLTHNYQPRVPGPARTGTNGPDRPAHAAGPYR
ncbi:MAG TPA: hypothetical protein VFN97_24925 [Actinospica sp.]|nr:hypothetical protein [Actinospica sp.]